MYSSFKGKHVITFCHNPIVGYPDKVSRHFQNDDEFIDWINGEYEAGTGKVRAVIYGHAHKNGLYYDVTKSTMYGNLNNIYPPVGSFSAKRTATIHYSTIIPDEENGIVFAPVYLEVTSIFDSQIEGDK